MNEAIRDVIIITRNEADRNSVSAQVRGARGAAMGYPERAAGRRISIHITSLSNGLSHMPKHEQYPTLPFNDVFPSGVEAAARNPAIPLRNARSGDSESLVRRGPLQRGRA
jgi:hypothetical protein